MNKKKIISKIIAEKVDYSGVVNFASRGIKCDPDGLAKAFNYGKEIGIECTKKDAIRIVENG